MVQPTWLARRESYHRLGHNKKRRLRDRGDISGMPDLRAERGKYGNQGKYEFLYKGTELRLPRSNVAQRFSRTIERDMPNYQLPEFVGMAGHVAKRFSKELERTVSEGITREVGRALKIVRRRAELQMGASIQETGAEAKYLHEIKAYVVRNVQSSAQGWEEDIRRELLRSHPSEVWGVLVRKETQAMNHATTAARTLLGATYNAYMAFLLSQDKTALFEWVNPLDARTTPCCQALVAATKGGVPLQQLKMLVQQHAERGFWRPKSPWQPHFSCRSTLVKVN